MSSYSLFWILRNRHTSNSNSLDSWFLILRNRSILNSTWNLIHDSQSWGINTPLISNVSQVPKTWIAPPAMGCRRYLGPDLFWIGVWIPLQDKKALVATCFGFSLWETRIKWLFLQCSCETLPYLRLWWLQCGWWWLGTEKHKNFECKGTFSQTLATNLMLIFTRLDADWKWTRNGPWSVHGHAHRNARLWLMMR